MKKEIKILLIGITGMLIMNFLGSIGSRMLDFNYTYLSPISFFIYAAIGFLVTKHEDLKTGVLFAAIIGFLESTLGSMVSKIFGEPNIGEIKIEMTTGLWVFTIVSLTIFAALIGLIGGGIATQLKKRNRKG